MRKTIEERFYDMADIPGYESWVKSKRTPDGKLIGYEVFSKNDDAHFCDLTEEEQQKAIEWIEENAIRSVNPLPGRSSYGMKHILENRTKIYMTNNQFKELMLLCGFFPVNVDQLNWNYCIRKSSPMFRRQADGCEGLIIPETVMDYSATWPKYEGN